MALTYPLQPVRLAELRPSNVGEGATVTLDPAATFSRGDLIQLDATGRATNLAAVGATQVRVALAMEDAVDSSHRGAGPNFPTAKPTVTVLDVRRREIVISSSGAAFAPATHLGVDRPVVRDASGRSRVDLADTLPANATVRIKRVFEESLRATNGSFGIGRAGDTGVLLVCEVLDAKAAVI